MTIFQLSQHGQGSPKAKIAIRVILEMMVVVDHGCEFPKPSTVSATHFFLSFYLQHILGAVKRCLADSGFLLSGSGPQRKAERQAARKSMLPMPMSKPLVILFSFSPENHYHDYCQENQDHW